MSQKIYLRDDIDAILLACFDDLFDVGFREGCAIAQLRMAFILIVEIDAKNKCVDFARCQLLVDEFYKTGNFVRAGCSDAESLNREVRTFISLGEDGA